MLKSSNKAVTESDVEAIVSFRRDISSPLSLVFARSSWMRSVRSVWRGTRGERQKLLEGFAQNGRSTLTSDRLGEIANAFLDVADECSVPREAR